MEQKNKLPLVDINGNSQEQAPGFGFSAPLMFEQNKAPVPQNEAVQTVAEPAAVQEKPAPLPVFSAPVLDLNAGQGNSAPLPTFNAPVFEPSAQNEAKPVPLPVNVEQPRFDDGYEEAESSKKPRSAKLKKLINSAFVRNLVAAILCIGLIVPVLGFVLAIVILILAAGGRKQIKKAEALAEEEGIESSKKLAITKILGYVSIVLAVTGIIAWIVFR